MSYSRSRITVNVVILIAALCAAGYSLRSFWPSRAPAAIKHVDPALRIITAPELKALLLRKEDSIVLVDVRERNDFQKEHIPSAINIPFDEIEVRAEDELSKSSHIVLSFFKCDQENSVSTTASSSLKNLGFTNVSVLDGGINKWKESSYDLQKE
jgi:rhodanese-related sulfurtransferase